MATVITLTNQKGGVGKTTSTIALITGLSLLNYKVLGIDLDAQGNLGFSMGLNIESATTIYDVLTGNCEIHEAIYQTEHGDVIPSNILLSGVELEFGANNREFLLKNAIAKVSDQYDFIVIDTPPALNILTVNAYVASNYLIVPMSPEILSLLGVSQLGETVKAVQTDYNTSLVFMGILLTRFNQRTNLAKEVNEMAQQIASSLGAVVFDAKIRPGVAVAEAPAHGESILLYSPHSKPAQDYFAFVNEVIARMKA
ncbi:MAG: ParA family protein [Bacillota bacterium]